MAGLWDQYSNVKLLEPPLSTQMSSSFIMLNHISRCFTFHGQKETENYFSLQSSKVPCGAYKKETEMCTGSSLCLKKV